jgi:parallel beta-helix repeat protein
LAAWSCALPAAAGEIRVSPGESIQAAVDRAAPGDRIKVLPGTYHEPGQPCPTDASRTCAVVVFKDNISLVGEPVPGRPVILENPGGQDTGITFARQGANGAQCLTDPSQHLNGASVQGFLVRNFGGNGIFLFCADNWAVEFNSVENNFLYGIFPSHCGPGRVSHNVASGAHDTGIYVGQSHDARIDHNVAHDNVSGFEVENSTGVRADHNEAFHNTGGILMFILPGLDVLTSQDNQLDHNFVHDNNSPNTCPPGDDVCLVPPGSGILAVAGEKNRIDHNLVLSNETVGIALVDVCTGFQIPLNVCGSLGFDPLPETTRIEFNTALENGGNPQAAGFPGVDLLWTGNGLGNCWEHNVASATFPSPLPPCP